MDKNKFQEKIIDVADVGVIILIGAVLMLTAFMYFVHNKSALKIARKNESAETLALKQNREVKARANSFGKMTLGAKAALVLDLNSGKILFEKNASEPLPLASLTKLMTALTVANTVPENTTISIAKEAIDTEGDTGLTAGERWNVRKLLDFTLLVSSNDGSSALAAASEPFLKKQDKTFVESMNSTAHDIGLRESSFKNETGLDLDKTNAGAYGSARDIVKLVSYILRTKPNLLELTRFTEKKILSEEKTHKAVNSNSTVGNIAGIIASKTGYSDLAGGNVAIVFDAGLNEPIGVVVLGSTFEGRFSDLTELVKATRAYIMAL